MGVGGKGVGSALQQNPIKLVISFKWQKRPRRGRGRKNGEFYLESSQLTKKEGTRGKGGKPFGGIRWLYKIEKIKWRFQDESV